MGKRKTKKVRLRLTRTLQGFAPASPYDEERIFLAYPAGTEVEVEFFQNRSLPRLRLYWGIMHHVFHNQDKGYASPEKISDALLVASGVCSPERRLDGSIVMMPDSIAFRNMDEAAFATYLDKSLELIRDHFGLDVEATLREGQRLVTSYKKQNATPTEERKHDHQCEAAQAG